jgi:putative Holliday junction resolvase
MRKGRRIAFDVGAARTGVAVCDPDCIFSSPVGVITSAAEASSYLEEYSPIELYVGLPLNLKGQHTASTDAAIEFAKELAALFQLEVRLIDERLTTKSAAGLLRQSGKDARKAKSAIDAASAALILEQAIALERSGSSIGLGILDI